MKLFNRTKKLKTIGPLRYAFNAPASGSLLRLILGVFVALLVAAAWSGFASGVTNALCTTVGAIFSWALLESFRNYKVDVAGQTAAQATKWVYEGEDESEVQSRRETVTRLGGAAALASAGVAWPNELVAVNVDGTPMLPGQFLDLHGNIYGDGSGLTNDIFATDAGTGMALDVNDAYSEPVGMDGGFSHDSHSGTGL